MIKTRELVPQVYYDESRDFQMLGRVYEALFNHCKTYADLMQGLPLSRESDYHMLSLMATTLGFNPKRDYAKDELRAVLSSFVTLVKSKGSIEGLMIALYLLLRAHGIQDTFNIERDFADNHHLIVYIPGELPSTVLLEDLFDYLLPAGFTYTIMKANKTNPITVAEVAFDSSIKYAKMDSTTNDTDIGLIATPSNIDAVTYDNISEDTKTSSVSSGTIVVPKEV
jgi:hypothetical protein